MAKSKKSKFKKEGRTLEVVSSDTTWNSIEEFTEAITASGILFNSDFIPVNIPKLYEDYTSNFSEFKETAVYKILTQ